MFNTISSEAFKNMALGAGVLLKTFNKENPSAPNDDDIICATSGGINISAVPTWKDLADGVDNAPKNMKEYLHIESWGIKASFTALDITADALKLSLGAADVTGGKVVPRADVKAEDFTTVYWVGETADGTVVYAELKDVLSTGGLSIKTTDNDKANLSVELTAHYSAADVTAVPAEFGTISK